MPAAWVGAIGTGLFLLLSFVVVPSLRTHFYSDDLVLLVENQSLPLTQSFDQLHRPLRNIILKLAERQFGLDPLPYRLTVFIFYLLFLASLGWLLLRLEVRQPLAVISGVALVAFFPRNHSALFWFAASQDVMVALLLVLSCGLFLCYRESGANLAVLGSAVAFGLALGFKETAIMLPALVLVLELYRRRRPSRQRINSFWPPYLIFAGVLLAYVTYFLIDREGATPVEKSTGGYYHLGGPLVAAKAFSRLFANLLLPFAHSFSLHEMDGYKVTLCILVFFGVAITSYRTGCFRALAAGLVWILLAAAPVSVFAHAINADHYLLVPVIGAAIVIASIIQKGFSANSKFVAAILLVYSGLGAYQLILYRHDSSHAAEEFGNSVQSLLTAEPPINPTSEVYVVGLVHSSEYYPVANNGFRTGLLIHGFPRSASLAYNFADPSEAERALLASIAKCRVLSDTDTATNPERVLLVNADGTPALDRTGVCAMDLIRRDQGKRPEAWFFAKGRAVSKSFPRVRERTARELPGGTDTALCTIKSRLAS